VFDNRGTGRTAQPDSPYSIEMMARDTVALMDALSIARADILGISMGGRIALELTLTHPARVRRLVLVSTSAAGRGKVHMSGRCG
jgi:pimeloyl-ACP methyl ester carboxylesterase